MASLDFLKKLSKMVAIATIFACLASSRTFLISIRRPCICRDRTDNTFEATSKRVRIVPIFWRPWQIRLKLDSQIFSRNSHCFELESITNLYVDSYPKGVFRSHLKIHDENHRPAYKQWQRVHIMSVLGCRDCKWGSVHANIRRTFNWLSFWSFICKVGITIESYEPQFTKYNIEAILQIDCF